MPEPDVPTGLHRAKAKRQGKGFRFLRRCLEDDEDILHGLLNLLIRRRIIL
jgi:hypothetical protein